MKEIEFLSILEAQGWKCEMDEAREHFCVINIDDVDVQVIPSVKKRADHFRVSLAASVSSREFSEAVGYIFGKRCGHVPVVLDREPPEKFINISPRDVEMLSGKVISWARSQDINAGLKSYRNLPTDAKGAMPLRHLAALSIAGDAARLMGYKECFDRGDRLGFVPYITAEMIVRAVQLAMRHGD
ncbi:DUF6990 domain-containing protein [Pseudomonas citronellolis]|uniref:DUF6990 domain-containing protein n=1 Tax=Pseudomonas citronellolis TaxID=53408 RepID=UPI0023E37520|nr:hypothetical protein [Pseudomonas citronellolis]MDF3931343.1 hypothetical protein [Pseudomonas citronellolis]